jgi:hypothetical protein
MSRAKKQDVGLFEESELEGIQASGSAWVVSDDDPATVPVPLQTVIMKVEGPYTERDRKLWVFLLHTVFDKLGDEPIHSVPIREINSVFRKLGGDHGTAWLWESAKRLSKTIIEFETTMGDERFLGVAALFGANVPAKAKRGSELHFFFPPNLIPIIKQPMRFARLRVHFMLKLSGKYAVTLYEILEGFANRRDGQCRVTIDELRTWLKVPDGTYPNWKDFRKWVLDPAIKQINDDPLGAGFSVEYKPIRKGRFYHEIVFHLTKTKKRVNIDNEQKRRTKLGRAVDVAKARGRPLLSENAINQAAVMTGYYLDMKQVEEQFWEHWEATGRPQFKAGTAKAFMGFTKKKLGQVKYGKR